MRKPTSIKAWANSSFFFYRYDYIAVYDLLDNQVGQRYCGSIMSPVYKEVKGNVAVVVFHSDSTNSKKGFVLSYEAHTCLTSAKVEEWRMIWSTTSDIQSELCYLSTIITLIQLWRCPAGNLTLGQTGLLSLQNHYTQQGRYFLEFVFPTTWLNSSNFS